ncbi:MAG: hypothetical protein AAFQ63_08120 [Cyanobacteria bacterium J06621_11]
MKRFILSAFSVLIATSAIAPTAQALPKVDPSFEIQTLRLRELDTRNKSEDSQQPYYPQTPTQSWTPDTSAEQESAQTTEPTTWENAEKQEEEVSSELTVTERRHQSLDRRS